MENVLIIEAQMKQYRAPFYARLYESLRKEGLTLTVAYSEPSAEERLKNDNCELPREYGRKVAGHWLLNGRLLFQPLLREIHSADLVISDQANKLVLSHYLLLLCRSGMKRVALWGHGENRQQDRSELSEFYRRWTLNWPAWWFAYTEGTAEYLQRQGIPACKITPVQNSVDTKAIQKYVRNLSAEEKESLRAGLGVTASAPVGIFVGAFHRSKSLPFLLEASLRIRTSLPDFHLILIGGGPEEEEIRRKASKHPWIHVMGPKFGEAKAELLGIADLFLLPGVVGLAILNSFAADLPLLATRLPNHGPEIEYLEDGQNGLIVHHDQESYAGAAIRLLSQPVELLALREGAKRSAEKYSIEAMVENFREGILHCLRDEKCKGISPKSLKKSRSHGSSPIVSFTEGLSAEREFPGASRAARTPSGASVALSKAGDAPKFLITTSWDDGHPLDFRIAELLEKYGLPGTFYVPCRSQRQVMSAKNLCDLSLTFEIGAHTIDHVAIDQVSDEEATLQLAGSRRWVEEVTGKACSVFCFPQGKFKPRQLRLIREAGFRAARTVELLSIGEPCSVDGVQIIPTTIQAFPHQLYTYAKNTGKRFPQSQFLNLAAAASSKDWVVLAQKLLNLAMKRGGVFHLWGHSWEIEEEKQWEKLEELMRALSLCRNLWKGVTNLELCGYAA